MNRNDEVLWNPYIPKEPLELTLKEKPIGGEQTVESIVNPSGPSETLLETPVGAGEAHVDSLSLGMEYILQNWTDPFGNDQNEESGGENQNPWVENVPEAEDVGDTVEGQTELIEEGTQTDMTPSFSDFRSGPEVSDRSEFMKGCVFGIKMMRAAEQTDASRTPSLAILGDLCKIVEPRDRNTQILAPEVQNTFQTIRGPSVPNELAQSTVQYLHYQHVQQFQLNQQIYQTFLYVQRNNQNPPTLELTNERRINEETSSDTDSEGEGSRDVVSEEEASKTMKASRMENGNGSSDGGLGAPNTRNNKGKSVASKSKNLEKREKSKRCRIQTDFYRAPH